MTAVLAAAEIQAANPDGGSSAEMGDISGVVSAIDEFESRSNALLIKIKSLVFQGLIRKETMDHGWLYNRKK